MKATGIVRRIDDLGRIVIPKEIRRTLRIREGDPLEIYTDSNGEVIFKKYSPIGEMSTFASQYAEVLYKATSMPTLVCDRDHIVAVSGVPKKEFMERRITQPLEDLMESRNSFSAFTSKNSNFKPVEGIDRSAGLVYPIIAAGDVTGAVIMLANEEVKGENIIETNTKLAQTAATFLGKQMEE